MNITAFSKTYDNVRVLNFPGMELESGKIYAIIGANGSGKSTFLKILAGAVKADRGSRHHDAPSLGYLPQKSHAFRMSTRANLMQNGADAARAAELMAAMQISRLAKKPAHKLSGGETARMALARLLMKEYALVALDEPTAAMDMEATALAEELIRDYVRRTGCTMLLVTHSLQQARRLADRVLYFSRGELAEAGDRDTVLNAPRDERTRQFLDFYGK